MARRQPPPFAPDPELIVNLDGDGKRQARARAHAAAARAAAAPATVLEATERAIAAAAHLTPMDAGAVEALRRVAATIDARPNGLDETGKLDNVSLPTYLKFCSELGLTPAGRERLDGKPKDAGATKLGTLRAVAGGRPAAR